MLWRKPRDIRSRNLYFGPGGKAHAPHSAFTFVREDSHGTSPKFDVRDEHGVKWRIKLGAEARPETVATRLVWAVGYAANEDYFVPVLRVEGLPARLHRGQNLIGPDGTIRNARLKRYSKGEKKIGEWRWRYNRFARTKELNGLRVMMALINNWDLKDNNNAVYDERRPAGSTGPEEVYAVSDLGASFGTTGRSWTRTISKGNLHSFGRSRFITKITDSYVDFSVPSRPALIDLSNPPDFISRVRLRWIGKRVPRADVRWIAGLLAQLSPEQIRDAFRAAGYTPEQVDGFTRIIEKRIVQLSEL
ncbi:MAG TPA: hypothetical protein VG204_03405 [Terriglobia bacterium]|nr:hypothetical protein [Terriglobia bacterium]